MEGRSCPLLDLPARELSPALVSMGLPRFFFKRTEASMRLPDEGLLQGERARSLPKALERQCPPPS